MPRRSALSPDEARAYLAEQNYPGAATLSDAYAKRLARGLQKGRSVAATRGHAAGEHHYERVRPVVFAPQAAAHGFAVTEFRMGRAPQEKDDHGQPIPPQVNAARSKVPQPADLIRLVEGYTRSSLINVGIWGYLLKYVEAGEEPPGYTLVHTWVQRDWFLARLKALPQQYTYTARSPAYLDLAHDLVAADESTAGFQARADTWQWGWIFQWTVRDREE